MDDYGFVADNVAAVRGRMAAACRRAGRDPETVELMAVTKFHPIQAVEAAYAAGVRLFGESRVQEASGKFEGYAASRSGARVHMIGHLQSNKAKKAVELFDCVQSVDSLELLAELGKRAAQAGRRVEILLELHTGEESKCGFPDPDSLLAAVSAAKDQPSLELRGLMTMAPFTDDEAAVRSSFRALASAFRRAWELASAGRFDVLSMGMTNDFELAIEEGSTLVRVGTAIFGGRAP